MRCVPDWSILKKINQMMTAGVEIKNTDVASDLAGRAKANEEPPAVIVRLPGANEEARVRYVIDTEGVSAGIIVSRLSTTRFYKSN